MVKMGLWSFSLDGNYSLWVASLLNVFLNWTSHHKQQKHSFIGQIFLREQIEKYFLHVKQEIRGIKQQLKWG